MLPRQYRLTTDSDFKQIFSKGRSINGNLFTFFIEQTNKNTASQFGIIVSNKVSKKAVDRNSIKRKVRDFLQKNIIPTDLGYKCVIVAKKSSLKQNKENIWKDLESIFSKTNK